MFKTKALVQSLALAGLLAGAGASQAAITVYTSLAAFTAAVGITGTDTFTGFNVNGQTAGPLSRAAGTYSYAASTTQNSLFYGAGTAADPALSTNFAEDTLVFSNFASGVVAFGGNIFNTSISGAVSPANVIVTATDSQGTITRTITNATAGSFLGFVSDTGSLLNTSIVAVQNGTFIDFVFPTIDNLVLASAVPEPETYALLLAGLGIVGLMARRRRAG